MYSLLLVSCSKTEIGLFAVRQKEIKEDHIVTNDLKDKGFRTEHRVQPQECLVPRLMFLCTKRINPMRKIFFFSREGRIFVISINHNGSVYIHRRPTLNGLGTGGAPYPSLKILETFKNNYYFSVPGEFF